MKAFCLFSGEDHRRLTLVVTVVVVYVVVVSDVVVVVAVVVDVVVVVALAVSVVSLLLAGWLAVSFSRRSRWGVSCLWHQHVSGW